VSGPLPAVIDAYDAALFDLDGVVYLGPVAVVGAADGIARLREQGCEADEAGLLASLAGGSLGRAAPAGAAARDGGALFRQLLAATDARTAATSSTNGNPSNALGHSPMGCAGSTTRPSSSRK